MRRTEKDKRSFLADVIAASEAQFNQNQKKQTISMQGCVLKQCLVVSGFEKRIAKPMLIATRCKQLLCRNRISQALRRAAKSITRLKQALNLPYRRGKLGVVRVTNVRVHAQSSSVRDR